MVKRLRQFSSTSQSTAASVGKRLREIRIRQGLTQIDLENRAGLLRSHISRIENGRRMPSLETLERLAVALQVPVYSFFYPPRPEAFRPGHAKHAAREIGPPSRSESEESPDSFLTQLQQVLRRLSESDRQALLATARKMARRSLPPRDPSS